MDHPDRFRVCLLGLAAGDETQTTVEFQGLNLDAPDVSGVDRRMGDTLLLRPAPRFYVALYTLGEERGDNAMCDDFDTRNKSDWVAAIAQAFGEVPPQSMEWTDLDEMLRVLTPFIRKDLDHIMMPKGGGQDMESIARSVEPGCLEFCATSCVADICRPAALVFEYFPKSEWNSFFLLGTQSLLPSGVYGDSDATDEEVCEPSPGEYIDRSHYDTGILGYDEDRREIPLPEASRIVSRHMQGKFLIVAKRSIWNCDSSTYDGRHSQMTSQQIREQIQNAIDRMSEDSQQKESGD